MARDKRFKGRALTSLTLVFSFIVMVLTGAVLYATPKGRVAYWIGWTFWGLDKDQWAAVHTTSSILFFVAGAFHIYFNWRPLKHYLVGGAAESVRSKAEVLLALTITAIVFAGTVAGLPPFDAIIEWNEAIKTYWEGQGRPAPYAHVEESSVAAFAEQAGAPLSQIVQGLEAKGYDVPDPSITIGALAARYNVTPQAMLDGVVPEGATPSVGLGSGSALGRMTIQGACAAEGLSLSEGLAALEARGIKAEANDSMRAVASRSGMTPRAVLRIIANEAQD